MSRATLLPYSVNVDATLCHFVLLQVSEDALLAWADEKAHADPEERRYVDMPDVAKFIEWLREDEDEDEDDDEDDEEDEE